MRRVTDPLALMGARFTFRGRDGLPVTVRGGPLTGIRYELPVSSAQLKSALLLAGVAGGVPVEVREPGGRSRDHTERMLRAFGYEIEDDGEWIRFAPTGRIVPVSNEVPGDPSSAAFLVGAALLAERGMLRLRGVGLNPRGRGSSGCWRGWARLRWKVCMRPAASRWETWWSGATWWPRMWPRARFPA